MTAPPAKSATRALQALFDEAGLVPAEPDILQPASVFLDLSGEDIRRRLFLVQDPAGAEFCLRPDYTIPVSRMHLAAGGPTPAGYSYLGPVFRYRPGGTGEFLQAGVERFGDADAEAADADVVAFSLKAVRAFGLERPEIRLGDPGLFMAFVSALGLPEPWPRRLRAAFGRPGGLLETLQPRERDEAGGRAPLLSSLARDDPAAARAAVEEMMAIAGIAPVGGRGPEEIAERLLEKAQLAAGGGIDPAAREVLVAAARVRGTPAAAHARFSGLAREAGLDLSVELAAFERRTRLMAERGVPVDRIRFAADFGRRLDYYTGFVFEVFDPAEPDLQAVGGGRYDRLLSMLGAPATIPAVGCAIWIDRLSGKEGR